MTTPQPHHITTNPPPLNPSQTLPSPRTSKPTTLHHPPEKAGLLRIVTKWVVKENAFFPPPPFSIVRSKAETYRGNGVVGTTTLTEEEVGDA
jgi:hypothetical protein